MQSQDISDMDIAIIGMSGRFPGARNVNEFWDNLCNGAESFSAVTDEEIMQNALGYVPEDTLKEWLNDPNYVKVAAGLDNIDLFDAAFFGYNSTEAQVMDPQQRIFLQTAWEAMEDAGYSSDTYNGLVGVYAGAEVNSYHHVHSSTTPTERDLLALLGNESGYLTARVSYKLNLRGPSVNIQSACATSLVAIHMACQSLRNGECDIALAGGVVAYATQKVGYLYQEGGMLSSDGCCRPFDARAQGTILASGGVGVVILKPLINALNDGDNVYAIIRGSAINNDGILKTSFTAPSIEGQKKVLLEALTVADVEPESVSYIEAHATGTSMGDSIEVSALTQAFSRSTHKKNFCAIGSFKSNIGYLGVASGVTGVIKTALALKHKMIPPSLHYEQPNPHIDFANSPFYVNTKLSEWKTEALPRRAGVSAFGIGGTNAHAILEEAPPIIETSVTTRQYKLLPLSAKTISALDVMTSNLIDHLRRYPDLSLSDAAFTLQVGRKSFPYRRMVVCRTIEEAISKLEKEKNITPLEARDHSIAFMFSGQGAHINMGKELYQSEVTFRECVDKCAELLRPLLGFDIRSILYPSAEQQEAATRQLNQTLVTQSALFVIEYALARQHPAKNTDHLVLSSLRHPDDHETDDAFLFNACGQLWCAGVPIDWSGLYLNEKRRRISLPTYPFECKRYWLSPQGRDYQNASHALSGKKSDIAEWFSIPSWKRSLFPTIYTGEDRLAQKQCWLVFADTMDIGKRLVQRLEQAGRRGSYSSCGR